MNQPEAVEAARLLVTALTLLEPDQAPQNLQRRLELSMMALSPELPHDIRSTAVATALEQPDA